LQTAGVPQPQSSSSSYTQIFDAEFMRKLERLSLVSRKLKAGRLKGERRSPRRGQSVEFADYRNYTHGDDLRRVDWNAYARLERLFIKLFQEEEDLTVHVLLDASKSMDWGDPDEVEIEAPIAPLDAERRENMPVPAAGSPTRGKLHLNKFAYAKRTAAALGYITLTDLDRLSLATFGGSGLQKLSVARGKGHAVTLLRQLAAARADGRADLNAVLKLYAGQARYPGLLFVLSDCLAEDGGAEGLSALQSAGHEVNLIHILSPAEIHPELALVGDLRLRDVETGETEEVSIDGALLDQYRERYEVWQGGIERFCRRRGIGYTFVTTDQPFEDLILHYLRRQGMLR
jgi:uncharacterized protein (DUF58 family)